jgi:hypothetical protein
MITREVGGTGKRTARILYGLRRILLLYLDMDNKAITR